MLSSKKKNAGRGRGRGAYLDQQTWLSSQDERFTPSRSDFQKCGPSEPAITKDSPDLSAQIGGLTKEQQSTITTTTPDSGRLRSRGRGRGRGRGFVLQHSPSPVRGRGRGLGRDSATKEHI